MYPFYIRIAVLLCAANSLIKPVTAQTFTAEALNSAKTKTSEPISGRASVGTFADLEQLLIQAQPGSTLSLPSKIFVGEAGSTIVVPQPVNVIGHGTVLVNIRLIFLANVELSGMTLIENDCRFDISDPNACSPATPMITVGYTDHPITHAALSNLKLRYGRAYTGIAFGLSDTGDLSIKHFDIVDNEMSAITGLSGHGIYIGDGAVTGSTATNVDDGIVLDSTTGTMSDVLIENVKAIDTFDAVGIGSQLFSPMTNILVRNINCMTVAACVYIKAGDQAPLPANVAGYSALSNLVVQNVNVTDTAGSRYLSAVWLYAKGGASAHDISLSEIEDTARSVQQLSARIKIFSDGKSQISRVYFLDSHFTDAPSQNPPVASVAGYRTGEGVYIQDLGQNTISKLGFSNLTIDGTAYAALDSANACVSDLSVSASQFLNINLSSPGGAMFTSACSFDLDGTAVH